MDEAAGRDHVAEAQVATATAALAAAREQLEFAKASQRKTTTLFAYARITAPFGGVITRRYADTGAMIQAGTASQTQTKPIVQLSEQRIGCVSSFRCPSRRSHASISADPSSLKVQSLDKTITGTVARFSDRLDTDTRTMHVEVDVPNPTLEIVPGMFANASITLNGAKDVLVAPVGAIDRTDNGAQVLVVDGTGRVEPRQVGLGLEMADRVEIRSGLQASDLVVVGNRAQLKAGAMVTPKIVRARDGRGVALMSRFSIRNPYFILVACLFVAVIGLSSVVRMPVDLFPDINIPQVVVATFYSGMPPEQIENDITGRFERFFTLGAGIDHMESRSLPGVSIIKVFFQPGTSADSDVTEISNLAMADLRRLPPGTLPPIVQKFDASSLPVCLITLKGAGMNETELRDIGQFTVRNQLASVAGASVPPPFGGKYRQIMVYVDPAKLQAYQMSPMDVVRAVNNANLILPSGDVKIGPFDYALFTNSQFRDVPDINRIPLKTVGGTMVTVADVGHAEDSNQIQNNIVRVDGQTSAYLPVMKQGGDTNTIAVVNGIKDVVTRLLDVPSQLKAEVVFDQSLFVKRAIETLLDEGSIGLGLTALLVLIFLGSFRATLGVFLSIPLSALAALIALYMGGSSINTMVLAGFALVFSRLIDNAVIVLENIFRHLELGESPEVAAEKGGDEVSLAVLAATLTSSIVFFPVTFLYGVSRFLFSALALAVVLALFASYFVAMTVVPLFCARFLTAPHHAPEHDAATPRAPGLMERFNAGFSVRFERLLAWYERQVRSALRLPWAVVGGVAVLFLASLVLYPLLGLAFFPRTDAGQFVINVKSPSGSRIEVTSADIERVERLIRRVVDPRDLRACGVEHRRHAGLLRRSTRATPGRTRPRCRWRSRKTTASAATNTWPGCERPWRANCRSSTTYFQSGGMVDAVLNQGLPAPIDVQLSGSNVERVYAAASGVAAAIRKLPGVSDVYIPQDIDYPSLRIDVDRERAAQLGLNQREVVNNVITALTSNQMIAPSYWVDPKSGNDYMLTVQYPENQVRNLLDLRAIPLHAEHVDRPDAARQRDPDHADDLADGNRSLPDPARDRHLREPDAEKTSARSRAAFAPSWPRPACRRACWRTSAAWCRVWRRRSAASRSG